MEHTAQVMLYSLLMSERCVDPGHAYSSTPSKSITSSCNLCFQ